MKKNIYLILCCLFFGLSASAANWIEIENKVYLDLSTWEYKNGYSNVWVKLLNTGEWKPINNQRVWYDIQRWQIDCTNHRLKINSSVTYGLKKQVLDSANIGSLWLNIVPDSVGESVYNYVCK